MRSTLAQDVRLPGRVRELEPMPGRVMREYVVAPQKFAAKKAELKRWLERAVAHAAALPTKAKKSKKK